jgi:hypothetical protein
MNEIEDLNDHVVNQSLHLRAVWTKDAAEDLRIFHNIDCENELTAILAIEMGRYPYIPLQLRSIDDY